MTVEAPVAPDGQIPEETPAVLEAPDAGTPSSSGSLTELSLAGLALTEPGVSAAEAPAEPVIGVRLLEGGIIEVALPPNREIEGPEARVAGEAVRMLAGGERVPVLLVISGVVGVSVEARQVYVGSIAASAFALVGESPVDRVIAHYLLRSRSEAIPAEFFISRIEALEWLRPYTSEK
ncbi:hypothetical protein [Arthrobacter sp. C9C5]|uniref:DUF7793 family protein n=1 Tax=Arthrobacter sp. C9C5 TaxID=2735267 RepID=UPI001585AA71|nr:hypothetical protein [Arthrobacter sp. C9C5]NUU31262.1 hypothetical protein [Arthrobacter sp. C9C5]